MLNKYNIFFIFIETNFFNFLSVSLFLSNFFFQTQNSQHEQTNKWEGCEHDGLDGTNLFNFMSKAIKNDLCSGVAIQIFRDSFQQKWIKFGNQFHSDQSVKVDNESVSIFDSKLAASTLRRFGHLIKSLSLKFVYRSESCMNVKEVEKILSFVNKYTHTSLDRFVVQFSGCDVDIFDQIIDEFTNLSRVSIHISQATTNTDKIRLNKIFPHVQYLDLNFDRITDPNFIDCEFEKLEHLHITAGQFDGVINTTFTNFMQKNPNITHMSIIHPTKLLLQIASKHLTKLRDLRMLQAIHEDSSCMKVYFPRVRTVVVRLSSGHCYPPRRITFGSLLDDIALICNANDIDDDYFNFLYKYPNITKLSAGIALNVSHLQKITTKLPKLKNAFLSFNNDITAENIRHFFDMGQTLNTLRFYHSSLTNITEFEQKLNKSLGNNFKMTFENQTNSKYFLVHRKNTGASMFLNNTIFVILTPLVIGLVVYF